MLSIIYNRGYFIVGQSRPHEITIRMHSIITWEQFEILVFPDIMLLTR